MIAAVVGRCYTAATQSGSRSLGLSARPGGRLWTSAHAKRLVIICGLPLYWMSYNADSRCRLQLSEAGDCHGCRWGIGRSAPETYR